MGLTKSSRALDSAFPRNLSRPLGHLRRFLKRDQLPAPLKSAIEADGTFASDPGQTIFVLIAPPLPDVEELRAVLAPFAPLDSATLSGCTETPLDTSSIETPSAKIPLLPIKIPIQPPFNCEQADNWTNNLWPVIFNPAAPRATVAPPLQVLHQALDSIRARAGYYLSLTRKVAEEAKRSGRGRGVGAVIVDPAIEEEIEVDAWKYWRPVTERWMDAVVAVGGDARYARSEAGAPSQTDLHPGPNPASKSYNADLEGGPDLHALMRATELVARRRREDSLHGAATAAVTPPSVAVSDPQLSMKLSPLEHYFLYGTDTPASHPPTSSSSLKKRKHEEQNPESRAVPPELNAGTPPQAIETAASSTPLPAPPPSTTASTELSIPDPNPEPSQSTPPPFSPPAANDSSSEITKSTTSKIRTRAQGGYLCTDLDVYLSHEPCLCCSMGILLSRFRAVIFPRAGRMKSGGLASEPVVSATPAGNDIGQERNVDDDDTGAESEERLYYGLHWRKELNWRALGFEFVEDEVADTNEDEGESVDFHA